MTASSAWGTDAELYCYQHKCTFFACQSGDSCLLTTTCCLLQKARHLLDTMDSALAPLQAQVDAVVNINAPDLLSYAGWMANQAALKQRMEGKQGSWLLAAAPRACNCSHSVRQRDSVVVKPLQLMTAELLRSFAKCMLVWSAKQGSALACSTATCS